MSAGIRDEPEAAQQMATAQAVAAVAVGEAASSVVVDEDDTVAEDDVERVDGNTDRP